MSLPWVRLDANIYAHDKVLWLLGQRDGYRAYAVYTFSMAYSGGHATDGYLPQHVFPVIHATEKVAHMLVQANMWEHAEGGYRIRNWEQRQELAVITEVKRQASRLGGKKSACKRLHGPDCECWRDSDAAILPMKRKPNA